MKAAARIPHTRRVANSDPEIEGVSVHTRAVKEKHRREEPRILQAATGDKQKAMVDKDSDDLSPSEFVANIRRLGEKKDQEDAERLAKLEEEIELGRRERELRRAGEFSYLPISLSVYCRIM